MDDVFENKISKVFYCYAHWQNYFNELQQHLGTKIAFVEGFSGRSFFSEQELENRHERSDPILIILDDCIIL